MTVTFEQDEQFIKDMSKTLVDCRAKGIATFEREAEKAAAAGKEGLSAACRKKAEEFRAYRFFWEREREAA
ncbi:hypothetical protein WEI85_12565 [Actinomycetes bacterium KLBMP 9797]